MAELKIVKTDFDKRRVLYISILIILFASITVEYLIFAFGTATPLSMLLDYFIAIVGILILYIIFRMDKIKK